MPSSIDLREPWWNVGDQGQTGSCVGWAVSDGVLRWHFVKAGRLDKSETLSVSQVWISAKEEDEFAQRPTTFIETSGTSLKAALDVTRKYGVVKNTVLPFAANNTFKRSEDEFYGLAAKGKINRYFDLKRDLNAWKKWIGHNGPLLARLNVDINWLNLKKHGKLITYDHASAKEGHAVVLVGYTPDYFIVRNSWGTNWGDGGYAYASNDYAYNAFTEVYGIVV